MRLVGVIALMAAAGLVFVAGCGKEEPKEEVKPPPPDPGWPNMRVEDAVLQYNLEEAHYHIRKGRYEAPNIYPHAKAGRETLRLSLESLGLAPAQGEEEERDWKEAVGRSTAEWRRALAYVRSSYRLQRDNDSVMEAADHMIPTYAPVWDHVRSIAFTGTGRGERCQAYTAVTGYRCPNYTERPKDEDGKVRCPVHRNQGKRDADREAAAKSMGGAAAAAGEGMPGPGGPGGAPGGAPGGMGGGMPGAGGPTPGGMPGGPPGGGGPGGGVGAKAAGGGGDEE